jgi:hypothetical protein
MEWNGNLASTFLTDSKLIYLLSWPPTHSSAALLPKPLPDDTEVSLVTSGSIITCFFCHLFYCLHRIDDRIDRDALQTAKLYENPWDPGVALAVIVPFR